MKDEFIKIDTTLRENWTKEKKEFADSLKTNFKSPIEDNIKVSFLDKLRLKFPAIKNLIVGVADLFTGGGASKIQNSIDAIFTDQTANENILSNKMESSTMLDTIKNFLTGFITRWILKIGGTFLLSAGFSEAELTTKLTEIISGFLAIGIGIIISLVQHKTALETDLKTIQK